MAVNKFKGMVEQDVFLTLALGDKLSKECMRVLNLTTDEVGYIISNGNVMDWDNLETISLHNPIPCEEENDRIDGVLFFGDGTIEFHLERECDAINWAEFSNDYIKMIIEELEKNQCSKFCQSKTYS